MSHLTIKRLTAGGVITNYHCVSRCGHCLYNCSPQRDKDYLSEAQSEKIFKIIKDMGCRSIHIGGGEPLLEPRKLMGVLKAARRSGVGIDYVETNSAWYVDADRADAMLRDLLGAGVQTLLVSISPFHNTHIPYGRVKGVIKACRRTGMTPFPWVNAFVRDLTRLDEDRVHCLDEFKAAFGADYLRRIPDRYWIHLGGRALDTFRDVYPLHPAKRILDTSPANCAGALRDSSHFHVDLYGGYIPGLCAGLSIDMDDLGRPLPGDKYPILERLAAEGVRGLYQLAVETRGYVPRREGYLNHCDLCTEIRNGLAEPQPIEFPELAPAGFYTEINASAQASVHDRDDPKQYG